MNNVNLDLEHENVLKTQKKTNQSYTVKKD